MHAAEAADPPRLTSEDVRRLLLTLDGAARDRGEMRAMRGMIFGLLLSVPVWTLGAVATASFRGVL